jgi:hypothetical protein
MLFFLLVVLRFFAVPVFLFEVAFAFCDGFGFGRGLGFAGLLVGDSSLLVVLIGPGGVEDSDISNDFYLVWIDLFISLSCYSMRIS